MSVPCIAVYPDTDLARRARLLDGISNLYSVRFVAGHAEHPIGAIMFSATTADALVLARKGVRCLAFLNGPTVAESDSAADVSFSSSPHVSPLFRGRTFNDLSINTIAATGPEADTEIIATKAGKPWWLRYRAAIGQADVVTSPAPLLEGSDYLFQHFREDRWAALFPLLHFVSEVSGWTLPPLRACFMFDDPNLHWGSYGYVKYREIAEAGKIENYHSSFATVPMDAWFVHGPTASLFRQESRQLSLLVHGNNHTRLELHRRQQVQPIVLAAQAIERISRLEEKSGLKVARVMAAPHGACSEDAAVALSESGFDAACISTGSLMARNPSVAWPASVGLAPAEKLGTLPVIPRSGIEAGTDVPSRLAAFLGQPIVQVGHHDDLRNGVGILSRASQTINSLGTVEWMDMGSISELNYFSRVRGRVLELKMYSRRIRVTVPANISQVLIHCPWLTEGGSEGVEIENAEYRVVSRSSSNGELIDVPAGEIIVRAVRMPAIDMKRLQLPWPSFHAILRRQLCEARDRLRPTLDRLAN
jgi:hypothetical protein